MFRRLLSILSVACLLAVAVLCTALHAADTEYNRKTLAGIQGFLVVVNDLQLNVKPYAAKANLSKEELLKDIENRLTAAGIRVLTQDEWVKTKGKPTLYMNLNTHEYQKYWYAYDIRIEFQQVVFMEANPAVKLLTDTWSTNLTGAVNIGTLQNLRRHMLDLADRFIGVYQAANPKKGP
jgi:hypothetical protein